MTQIKVIEDFSEFCKLEEAWDELVEITDQDHAFARHVWFASWIIAFKASDSLAIVGIWSDGQLAAVAPVCRSAFRFRGIQASGLSFISSRIAPRNSFLVSDSDLLAPLVDKVLELPNWDIFLARNLEVSSKITSRCIPILTERRSRNAIQFEEGFQSPYMLTEGSWEEYWNSLPKKRRGFLTRMCAKRLKKADNHEIRPITTPEQFEDFKDKMFEVSAKSWKAERGDHLQPDSCEGRLYVLYTPPALERGLVTLYTLSIDGQVAGFEYLLTCNNRHSLIRCDYDEDFKYYSVGNNLRLAILKDLFQEEGTSEYDLGGDAYPYKLEWCDKIRKHVTLTIGNDTWRGRGIMLAKNKILPFLRKVGIDSGPNGDTD